MKRLKDFPEKHRDVVLAWFHGASVEWRFRDTDTWCFSEIPMFYQNYQYRVIEQFPVRDGFVKHGDKVWWHCEDGPEYVEVSEHETNIREYPKVYSIARPSYRIVYDYEK